jgi:glycosyltransferase involved in cell wall biosynthesis
MKILQVTNFFKPSWDAGGVARSAYEISKSLVKLGHDVTVFTTDAGNERLKIDKNKPINVDGIETYYFKNISNTLARPHNITTPYCLPFVAQKQIKNFDIIHIHEHRTNLAAIVSYYAKKYNIPFVLQPRGSAQKEDKTLIKTLFDLFFGYKILNNAKKVILSSNNEYSISKEILKKGGVEKENILYIPNGIDTSFYKKLPLKNSFRKKYNIKNSEKIILYLGRIHKRKGIDLLINSYEQLLDEKNIIDSRMIITGPNDNHEKELKELVRKKKIEKNVLFTGPLYEQDKIDAYISSDVFVSPSIDQQESFGNVVLEASACGTTCVVTKVCGVSEYLCNIIKVNPDFESIKEGIKKALQKNNIGEQARKEVLKKFSWEKITKTVEATYEEIISNV